MRLNFNNERVLAVVAHPDDAELLCAGTLARAKADGAVIGVCVLCRGDKGQPDPPIENLSEVRRGEMQDAVALLEAELLECGIDDGELFDSVETRKSVVELFRQFCPTLVLAQTANDYHPDHRAASELAEAASWFCASTGHKTNASPLAQPPTIWWMDNIEAIDFTPQFFVDITEFVDLKRRLIRCHRSQLERGKNADFSPLEEMMIRQCHMRGAQSGVVAAEAFRSHTAWKRARAW